jgi:hypothetical protein
MSPEVNAATSVGAWRMKIVSDGTPYLEKKPYSLAAQRGRTRAFTAAWAMMLLAGADAAWVSLNHVASPSKQKTRPNILCIRPSLLNTAHSVCRQGIWIPAFAGMTKRG